MSQSDTRDGPSVYSRIQERRARATHLLVVLKGGGDSNEVFQELFELFYKSIHAFFQHKGFSGEDRRDLAQETFLCAFQGIDDFRGESRFDTWLYEIARNVQLKEIRRRNTIKRKKDEVSLDSLSAEPLLRGPALGKPAATSPEDRCLASEERELVRAEVEQMPPQMQRCYRLWAEGYTYGEIAELLGISIDGVRGHLGAAKARLKNRLGEDSNDDGK